MDFRTNALVILCSQSSLSNSLFLTLRDLGIEFKPALTVLAFDVLICFFLAELHLRAKTMRAFEISKQFLDMTPLRA